MIAPLTTMVRCDAKAGKDGDRCKGSFALTLESFEASKGELLSLARGHRGWFVSDAGVAFCPGCVVGMAQALEELENARKIESGKQESRKGNVVVDQPLVSEANEALEGGS